MNKRKKRLNLRQTPAPSLPFVDFVLRIPNLFHGLFTIVFPFDFDRANSSCHKDLTFLFLPYIYIDIT
jgi:hypothetical protein